MNAIYEGTLKHTRTKPKKHAFEYQIRLLYLDLDNVKSVFSDNFFWSYNRFNLGCFLRSDYFGNKKINYTEFLMATLDVKEILD